MTKDCLTLSRNSEKEENSLYHIFEANSFGALLGNVMSVCGIFSLDCTPWGFMSNFYYPSSLI